MELYKTLQFKMLMVSIAIMTQEIFKILMEDLLKMNRS